METLIILFRILIDLVVAYGIILVVIKLARSKNPSLNNPSDDAEDDD
jgi:hypothetical protein